LRFLIDRRRQVPQELFFRIHSLCERLDDLDPYLLDSVKAIVIDT